MVKRRLGCAAGRSGPKGLGRGGTHRRNRGLHHCRSIHVSELVPRSYLAPEPLLQSPAYVRRMAQGGVSVPTYAYGLNNPLRYGDPDGRKVNSIGIGNLDNWATAHWVSATPARCPADMDSFVKCFGSDPWSDSIDPELVSGGALGGATASPTFSLRRPPSRDERSVRTLSSARRASVRRWCMNCRTT